MPGESEEWKWLYARMDESNRRAMTALLRAALVRAQKRDIARRRWRYWRWHRRKPPQK